MNKIFNYRINRIMRVFTKMLNSLEQLSERQKEYVKEIDNKITILNDEKSEVLATLEKTDNYINKINNIIN